MANAIASQVQALYVGYLGRAADQAGLDFWTNAITAGTSTLESVALGFTLSAEYESLYAGKTNEELAAAIYENVLGRAADADGLAFWVGEIENGTVTADTLLAAMLNSLGTVDQQTIDNKVYVANAYTAAAGSDYDAEDGAAILVGVDSTAASVAAALASVPLINADGLTAALATLANAEAALDDFLQSTALGDNPATATVEETERADVLNEVDNAGAGVVSQFNGDYTTTLNEDSTANARTGVYGTLRADAEADILAAKDAVATAQAAVTATGTATAAEIAAYKAAIAAEEVTTAAVESALDALEDAELLFSSTNHQADVEIQSDIATWTGVIYDLDGDDTPEVGEDLIVESSTDGVFEVAAGIVSAGTAAGASAAAKLLLADAQAVLSVYQAAYNAEKADAAAELALTTATGKLGNGAAKAEVDTLISKQADLTGAQEDAATLESDIADVEAAYELYAQLLTLEGNVEKAVDAINDAGWNVVTLGSPLDTVVDTAGEGGVNLANDVFLFGGDASTVAGFNTDGTDLIKFAAGDYTLVNVTSDDFAGTKALGSVSALEIFVVDDGASTTLYVEQNAFDGSTNAAQANLVAIQLTGVTDQTASLSDAGYLSFA